MTTIQRKKYVSPISLVPTEYQQIQKLYEKNKEKLQHRGVTTMRGFFMLAIFDFIKRLEAEDS